MPLLGPLLVAVALSTQHRPQDRDRRGEADSGQYRAYRTPPPGWQPIGE